MTLRWAFAEGSTDHGSSSSGLAAGAAVALVVVAAAALAPSRWSGAAVGLSHASGPQHFVAAVLGQRRSRIRSSTNAPLGRAPSIRYAPQALIDLHADPGIRNESRPASDTRLGKVRSPLALPPRRLGYFCPMVGGCVEQRAWIGFRERAAVPSAAFARGSFDQAERGREACTVGAVAIVSSVSRLRSLRSWCRLAHRLALPFLHLGELSRSTGVASPRRASRNRHELGTFINGNTAGIFSRVRVDFACGGRFTRPRACGTSKFFSDRVSRERFSCRDRGRAVSLAVAAVVIVHVRFRRWVLTLVVFSTVAAGHRWPASHGEALWSPRGRG